MCGGVAVTMWGQAALAAGAGVVLLGYWQLMLHLHASAGAIDSPNTARLPWLTWLSISSVDLPVCCLAGALPLWLSLRNR